MSTKNQISVEVPQAVIDNVIAKLQECKTDLAPYLQGLTAKERKDLFKMGDKTVATVQKTKSYVETNPEFIPAYMDKLEFMKDVNLVTQLEPIKDLASQLAVDVSDTVMLSGSEALMQALLYYGQVKEANSKGVAASRSIYDDLKMRFARGSYKPREGK